MYSAVESPEDFDKGIKKMRHWMGPDGEGAKPQPRFDAVRQGAIQVQAALLVQTDFEMRMRRLCDAAKVSPGDVGLEANPAAKLKQEPTRETVRFSTAYK